MAKLGVFHTFRRMSPHAAPPFVNVPFMSFAASQVAIHGTLAALIERERSGAGQWVETNLVQAFTTLDTWAWFEHLIADRWPDAFIKTDPYDSRAARRARSRSCCWSASRRTAAGCSSRPSPPTCSPRR